MAKIKILIVEDEPLIAEDIRELLSQVNYQVVGVAFNKEDAFSLLQTTQPDIALLDINLGDNTDGITIAETINEKYNIPFLYLTSYSSKLILDKVKHTFPMGYIVKPFEEANLFTAVEIALSNFQGINKTSAISIELFNNILPTKLTQSEFEIVNDIYLGKNNIEMAEANFISVNTVKTHVKKIYEKLDVNSRATAIVKIRELLNS